MKRLIMIVVGCLLASIGALILKHAGVMTGGTGGLALIICYASDLPFGLVFFLVNIPFYVVSVIFMGWNFTLTTLLSVSLLSFITGIDHWLPSFTIPALVGAGFGGIFIGFGLTIIFMNRTSLGGSNSLALILQKKLNWDPGKVNFLFEFIVVLYGFYSLGLEKGLISVFSIFLTSSIISFFKNSIRANNETVNSTKSSYSQGRTELVS